MLIGLVAQSILRQAGDPPKTSSFQQILFEVTPARAHLRTLLFWSLTRRGTRRIRESLVVVFHLARRTVLLHDVSMWIFQFHRKFVHSHPRLRIHLGIVNRYRPLQVIMVHAMDPLLHVHLVADGTSGRIQPDSVFSHHPRRLNDERGIVQPFPDRVAVIARFLDFLADEYAAIDQLWKFAAICPDYAPGGCVLVQDGDLVLVLQDLRFPQVVKIHAWESQRLTFVAWIIVIPGQIFVGSKQCVMGLVGLQSVRRVWQLMFRLSVIRHGLYAIGLDPLARTIRRLPLFGR